MEEVKIQGGKVLNACREVQIQVLIYHNDFEESDFCDVVEMYKMLRCMLAERFRYRCRYISQ